MRNRWVLAALGLSLCALAVVATRVDPSHAVTALAHANWWWVAASAAAHVLSIVIESARWDAIVRGVNPRARLWDACVAMCVGTVGNMLLPLKLGEGARAWALSRLTRVPFSTALSTVIADRVVDSAVFLVLAIAIAWFYPPAGWLLRRVVLGLAALAVVGGGLILASRRIGRTRPGAAAHANGWAARARSAVDRGLSSLRSARHLGPACAISVASWSARTFVVWTMFKAFGLDLSFVAAGASLIIIILSIVTVSTPGNVGVFELSTVLALGIYGIPGDTALGFALVLHAAEIGPTFVFGFAAMWRLGIHMSDLARRATQPEEAGVPASPS
jgi:uncharacterized membrane protein YbhN (UPF0104 family)